MPGSRSGSGEAGSPCPPVPSDWIVSFNPAFRRVFLETEQVILFVGETETVLVEGPEVYRLLTFMDRALTAGRLTSRRDTGLTPLEAAALLQTLLEAHLLEGQTSGENHEHDRDTWKDPCTSAQNK